MQDQSDFSKSVFADLHWLHVSLRSDVKSPLKLLWIQHLQSCSSNLCPKPNPPHKVKRLWIGLLMFIKPATQSGLQSLINIKKHRDDIKPHTPWHYVWSVFFFFSRTSSGATLMSLCSTLSLSFSWVLRNFSQCGQLSPEESKFDLLSSPHKQSVSVSTVSHGCRIASLPCVLWISLRVFVMMSEALIQRCWCWWISSVF